MFFGQCFLYFRRKIKRYSILTSSTLNKPHASKPCHTFFYEKPYITRTFIDRVPLYRNQTNILKAPCTPAHRPFTPTHRSTMYHRFQRLDTIAYEDTKQSMATKLGVLTTTKCWHIGMVLSPFGLGIKVGNFVRMNRIYIESFDVSNTNF